MNTRYQPWRLSNLLHVRMVMIAVGLATLPTPAGAAPRERALPDFKLVSETVQRHLAAQPGYRSGFILSQSSVAPVIQQLRLLGWTVPDRKSILSSVPKDHDFLVAQLNTPAGRKFMVRISKYPLAYDRLDRMSRIGNGRRTVHDLIKGPGGEKMIHYLTSTSGGKELGKMLSAVPGGVDFNKPTGRIYTEKHLLAALKKSYAKTQELILAAAKEKNSSGTP